MKSIVFVCLIFVLLLLFCMFCVWYISNSAEHLFQQLNEVREMIAAEEWTDAEQRFISWSDDFESVKQRWEILIIHEDMRDIEIAIVDLKSALQQHDAAESLKELNDLAFFLLHVPDTERVDWGNVL